MPLPTDGNGLKYANKRELCLLSFDLLCYVYCVENCFAVFAVFVACGEDCNTKGWWAGGICAFLLFGLPAFELTFREERIGYSVAHRLYNNKQVKNRLATNASGRHFGGNSFASADKHWPGAGERKC